MFERYTEKARRVVFFARYEANQFGSPLIDTEHLLLGLLRENKELMNRVQPKVDYETARQAIASRIKPVNKISTNVDLPLSDHAKRALVYGAEEADRLNHRHIGTEHLLLGLLRDKEFASAKFLSRFGTNLESLRKRVESLGNLGNLTSPRARSVPVLRRPPPPSTVEIHGVKRNLEHVRIYVSHCREYAWHWEQKPWRARDIVIKKDGKGFSFDLALAENSSEFMLVQGGWKKDHCQICHWELFESNDASHGTAFTNGKDWVCTECHQKFIAGDFFLSTYSDIT
jgi:ATP-dependent Clp protease ATP-binding subunit ClpA